MILFLNLLSTYADDTVTIFSFDGAKLLSHFAHYLIKPLLARMTELLM